MNCRTMSIGLLLIYNSGQDENSFYSYVCGILNSLQFVCIWAK